MDSRPMRPGLRMSGPQPIGRYVRLALKMVAVGAYGGWLGLQHLAGWQYGVIAVATIALMVVG